MKNIKFFLFVFLVWLVSGVVFELSIVQKCATKGSHKTLFGHEIQCSIKPQKTPEVNT